MGAKMQLRSRSVEDEPRFVVGMDAHARKLAVSVWDWTDRLNPCLHREIKCVDVDAMVKTYERHVDLDSITVIEASTNAAILKRRLNEAGFRAEVVRRQGAQAQGLRHPGRQEPGARLHQGRRQGLRVDAFGRVLRTPGRHVRLPRHGEGAHANVEQDLERLQQEGIRPSRTKFLCEGGVPAQDDRGDRNRRIRQGAVGDAARGLRAAAQAQEGSLACRA